MAVIDEKNMNNGKELSEDQIKRIDLTMQVLGKNSNNAQAITLAHNLKMSHTLEEKRKWIVMYYVHCFQFLSFVNMARDKEAPLDVFEKDLRDLFKGK